MHTYFIFFKERKNVSYTRFAFHSKNSQINYTVKYLKQNASDLKINSKGSTNFLGIFWYHKEVCLAKYQNKRE
jgi:hypothetical protein